MMVLSIGFTSISASNIDRGYTYHFTTSNNLVQVTTKQPKENDTSLYMYYVSGGPTYVAHAAGYTTISTYKDCSYDKNSAAQFSYKYEFKPGQRRYMYNYVRENGYSYAGVYARAYTAGSASGVWSPDSVYESGVISANNYIK